MPIWTGIFFTFNGLNYKAILETAVDVAKAMVHLHLANVLHSDLKVCLVGKGCRCRLLFVQG